METFALCSKITQQTQDTLVESHLLLVKRIAYHLRGRLPQTVQLDDLLQAGMLGLLEAAKYYDESKGASFETYAGIRIRGYMLDEVRRNDWVPRSVHRNSRAISNAMKQVENQLGRAAKDIEVAEVLGLSLEAYHVMLQDSASSHLYGFEDLGVTDDLLTQEENPRSLDPHQNALHHDLMNCVTEIIDSLPPKERLVLSLYYEHDLNLKEIGEIIEVGESRVSQILSQATCRIKSKFPDK